MNMNRENYICGGLYADLSGSSFKSNLEEIFDKYDRIHVKASFDPRIFGFGGIHKRTKKDVKVIFGGSDDQEIDRLLVDPEYEDLERCVYVISKDEITVRDTMSVFSKDLMGIGTPETFKIEV